MEEKMEEEEMEEEEEEEEENNKNNNCRLLLRQLWRYTPLPSSDTVPAFQPSAFRRSVGLLVQKIGSLQGLQLTAYRNTKTWT